MAPGLWSLMQHASERTGLSIDRFNFIFFQISSLILAVIFKVFLHPHHVSPKVRHFVAAAFGLYIGWFSYSWSFLHLLTQSTIPYIMMRTMSPRVMHKFVFTFAVVYMSGVHISQQMKSVNIYLMDHIGPMMVMTEKVTSLAFSLRDGLTRDESELSPLQKKMATKRMPTILEYYSYIFYFQALVVGPVCFYNNYIDFIEGRHIVPYVLKTKDGKEIVVHKEPPVWKVVFGKLLFSIAMAAILLKLVPRYPLMGNVNNTEVFNSSLLYKFWYVWVSVEVAKSKYFFAWIYADAVNNASGLGFNGYDEKGTAKWDLVTNIDVKGFETATSLKVLIDCWNKQTNVWLRYVCYDRVPFQKTLLTFILSSMWHGFFPGYFWTFIQGAFITAAGKRIRQNIRPYFQGSKGTRTFYDIVTWFGTHIALAYLILPFTLLKNDVIINYYSSMYFSIHIIALSALLCLPMKKPPTKKITADQGIIEDVKATGNGHLVVKANGNGTLDAKKRQ
ncbi:membrane-bound glycerophospholipid O-acyltransferase 2-like [Glandiceps talaboti]